MKRFILPHSVYAKRIWEKSRFRSPNGRSLVYQATPTPIGGVRNFLFGAIYTQTLFTYLDCMKRSKFENFAQFTSWFLTSLFHGGGWATFGGISLILCLTPPMIIQQSYHDIMRMHVAVWLSLLEYESFNSSDHGHSTLHSHYSWIGQWVSVYGLTSHSTHYRSFRGRFLQARWPNQCQSTERNQLVVEIRLESHQNHSTMLQ